MRPLSQHNVRKTTGLIRRDFIRFSVYENAGVADYAEYFMCTKSDERTSDKARLFKKSYAGPRCRGI